LLVGTSTISSDETGLQLQCCAKNKHALL